MCSNNATPRRVSNLLSQHQGLPPSGESGGAHCEGRAQQLAARRLRVYRRVQVSVGICLKVHG